MIKKERVHQYREGDIIIVVDPLSPYEDCIGEIIKADNERLRYMIKFKQGRKDTFWYNQIKPYRTIEELEALIDLSLTLGEAGKPLFEEWLIEYKEKKQEKEK